MRSVDISTRSIIGCRLVVYNAAVNSSAKHDLKSYYFSGFQVRQIVLHIVMMGPTTLGKELAR